MTILNKEKILDQARIFIEEGKLDRAIKEYEKILRADSSDMRVKLRIAELYVKRKQVADAIRMYRDVATSYTHDGFYLKAVTVYKNILRLNPSLIDVNELLAALYEKMGLTADAVRQFDIVATALEHKGEFDRVLDIRKKIVELSPDDGGARIRLAELYQREGKHTEALDQYEDYSRKLEESGGSEVKLTEMYEKILSHRENKPDMLRRLVRIYYKGGQIKKALKWLEFAKTLTPVDIELLGMQAEIYSRLNQLETARAKYIALADLYRESGDVENAIRSLVRIVLMIPGEEERVEKRVEEVLAGNLDKFKSILAQMRDEESKSTSEDESGRASAEGESKKTESYPKKNHAPTPEQPSKVHEEQAPESRKEEKPRLPDPEEMKQARASLDLAKLYFNIGLNADAVKELAKAEHIYSELSQVYPEAKTRLEEIKKMKTRT